MQFSAAIFALASAAVAFAAEHTVLVGDGGLVFNPPSITAQNGDNVIFEFRAKNHTVTQSTFANPCTPITTPAAGVDSGYQFVNATSAPFPTWSITVDDASGPLWFFCAQANHCKAGMVFAINPTAEKSFEAYQAAAKASTPGAAVSAPAGSASAVSGSTTATGSALSGAVTGTASGASSLAFPSAVSSGVTSGAPTSATLGAQIEAQSALPLPNSAMRVGSGASGLLMLAGVVAGLML